MALLLLLFVLEISLKLKHLSADEGVRVASLWEMQSTEQRTNS